MPTTEIEQIDGKGILDLLAEIGIVSSKAEARRLIQQNGLTVNDKKITDANLILDKSYLGENGMIVKKGKKVFHRVILK